MVKYNIIYYIIIIYTSYNVSKLNIINCYANTFTIIIRKRKDIKLKIGK